MIIIKLFCSSVDLYNRYNRYINKTNITKEYLVILESLKEYYNKFEEHKYLSSDELKTWFHHVNPAIKDKELYDALFERLSSLDISDTVAEEIVTNMIEKEYANKIITTLIPVIEDSSFRKLNTEVKKLVDEYEEVCNLKKDEEDNPFVTAELETILEETTTGSGLHWRLDCLNKSVGLLRGGNLMHVFARPDMGKTSFLASEATFIASQLKDDEVLVWINNEEKGSKVRLRTYQACLGANTSAILTNLNKAKELYKERGGSKILIYDDATVKLSDIKKLFSEYNIRVMIIDQGDKVAFSKDGDMSQADRLQRLYQHYRELAKKYNADIITAGQCSGEGEGKKWLTMDMMNNSKTGKPGELDVAIGIGATHEEQTQEDDGVPMNRYIHVCKNKHGPHGKAAVLFDATKARYKDQ